MVCQTIDAVFENIGFIEYLVYPTTCYYYFYGVIFFLIWAFLTLIIYNSDTDKIAKADMISSMAISATAVLFLAPIATLIKTSSGIPMLQRNIFLVIVALWTALAIIWFFKK